MKRIKFVHCADIHLDAPFISLGIKDNNSFTSKSALRRMDLKNTFKNIMKLAQDEGAGYIFISGDLYEHSYVRKSTINYVNGIFKSLDNDKIKVFIAPGNHDPWAKGSYYVDFEWADNVYILAGDKTHVCFEEEGICIYGPGAFPGIFMQDGFSDFSDVKTGNRSLGIERSINRDFINILLVHGTLDLNIGQDTYNSISSRKLESLGMDYIALGHFHKRTDSIGDLGIIYNPGSPEPLGFDEPGEHGVYVGSIVKRENEEKFLNVKFNVTNVKRYEAHFSLNTCHLFFKFNF